MKKEIVLVTAFMLTVASAVFAEGNKGYLYQADLSKMCIRDKSSKHADKAGKAPICDMDKEKAKEEVKVTAEEVKKEAQTASEPAVQQAQAAQEAVKTDAPMMAEDVKKEAQATTEQANQVANEMTAPATTPEAAK